MNCDTLLMAKERFGLVREGYCRDPTMLQHIVGLVIVGPSYLLKVDEANIGEEIGFAKSMLVLDNKSCIIARGEHRVD
jgi:hypothetical protein